MKGSKEKKASGEWISIKSFKFPDDKFQRLTVVYTSSNSEAGLNSECNSFSMKSTQSFLSKPGSKGNIFSSTTSIHPMKDRLVMKRASTALATQQKDPKIFNVLTPKNVKKKVEMLRHDSIVKKPLHSCKFLKLYHSSIKSLIKTMPSKNVFYQPSSKISYLDLKKIKLQAWIPQPLPSDKKSVFESNSN